MSQPWRRYICGFIDHIDQPILLIGCPFANGSRSPLCELTLPFSIVGFVVYNDALHAVTNVAVATTNASGMPVVGAFEGILVPVRIRKSTARVLRLEFEQLPIELLGSRTEPSRATLEIAAGSGPGLLRSDLLWAIANTHEDSSATPELLARLLNHLLTPVA